ncbi:MAG TPA: helix-hairpin-helix domain-containing protein [bacterium]|nr:helix-hairpin-helix domain-containing protein [bacterium]
MHGTPFKKTLLTAFPLTSLEKKVLGFLGVLLVLGAATLGLGQWRGQSLSDWAFRPAQSRVALPVPPSGGARSRPLPDASHPLDVNRAPADSLRWVPGVGPKTADQIVQYRKAHGPFQSVSGLQEVPGVGPQKYARMAPYLAVAPEKGKP